MAGNEVFFLLSSIVVSFFHHKVLGQTCDVSWRFHDELCFKHFHRQLNHSEAENQCVTEGGQLMSNLTNDLLEFLSEEQDAGSSFWIGNQEEETPILPPLWIPTADRRRKRYITIGGDLSIEDYSKCSYIEDKRERNGPCDKRRGYICEKNTTSPTAACLQDATDLLAHDWYTAREICQSNGSDLYSYKDETEVAIFLEYVEGMHDGMWIGLRREPNSSDFRWSDGSYLNYTNWSFEQPEMIDGTKLCVALSGPDLQWEVQNCNCSRRFTCKPSNAEMPITMTSEPSEVPTAATSESSAEPTAVTNESSEEPAILKNDSSEESTAMTSESWEEPTLVTSELWEESTTMTSELSMEASGMPRISSTCPSTFEYLYVAAAIVGTTALIIATLAIAAKIVSSRKKETKNEVPAKLMQFQIFNDGIPTKVAPAKLV